MLTGMNRFVNAILVFATGGLITFISHADPVVCPLYMQVFSSKVFLDSGSFGAESVKFGFYLHLF